MSSFVKARPEIAAGETRTRCTPTEDNPFAAAGTGPTSGPFSILRQCERKHQSASCAVQSSLFSHGLYLAGTRNRGTGRRLVA